MQSNDVADTTLKPNTTIANRWKIIGLIAQGGFGRVYKAVDSYFALVVALKLQYKRENSKKSTSLWQESEVFRYFMATGSRHCPTMYDYHFVHGFSLIAAELLGESLSSLRHRSDGLRFSTTTVARLAVQCVEALRDFHSIGFVHCDVKAGNFTIGRGSKEKMETVYLIDYGLARRYINQEGAHVRRTRIGFTGTARYASMFVHNHMCSGRRDDLWSFFYMVVEMLHGSLPWSSLTNRREVHKCKLNYRPKRLIQNDPIMLGAVVEHLQRLRFKDTPNYGMLIDAFSAMHKMYRKSQSDDMFDWLLTCTGN